MVIYIKHISIYLMFISPPPADPYWGILEKKQIRAYFDGIMFDQAPG